MVVAKPYLEQLRLKKLEMNVSRWLYKYRQVLLLLRECSQQGAPKVS